jgi:hypothetical protein
MRKRANSSDQYDELSAVDSAYQQGKTDAANGMPPADEYDAGYMNGYNESKTSSKSDREINMNDMMREWRRFQGQNWYDGTVQRIASRLDEVEAFEKRVSRKLRTTDEDSVLIAGERIMKMIASEIEALSKSSMALSDSDLDDYLDSMPALTVAKDYGVRMASDGLMDLGPDDGSWLFEQASSVNKQAASFDWDQFTDLHAKEWAEDRPSSLLASEMMFREAAIDYVEDKTEMILDVRKRASIIDKFVMTAERSRREINSPKKSAKRKTANSLLKALTDQGWDEFEAEMEIYTMRERVDSGEDPEQVLSESGLEPDYVEDLLSDSNKISSKKTAAPGLTQTQIKKAIAAFETFYAGYSPSYLIDNGEYGWGGGNGSRAIVWEGGPYEWSMNWKLHEAIQAAVPDVWCEPYNGFSLVLYRNN